MKKIFFTIFLYFLYSCGKQIYLPKSNIAKVDTFIADTLLNDSLIGDKWWQEFGDNALDSLVKLALLNNSELQQTMLAVENMKLNSLNFGSERLPQFSLDGGVTALGGSNKDAEWGYSAMGKVSWQVDLFGKLRNSELSSYQGYLASQWGARAVRLTLIESVANVYFAYLSYREMQQVATVSFKKRFESQILVDSMYRYGAVSLVELEQAKSLTFLAKSSIYQYKELAQTSIVQLSTLLAVRYDDIERILDCGGNIYSVKNLVSLPVSAPSLLLERRPDVIEAYYNYQKALYTIKEARANRFPSIALSWSGGTTFVSAAPWLWSGGLSLLEPIFKWGINKRVEQAAINSAKAAALAYGQSYIVAVGDVNNALAKIFNARNSCLSQLSVVKATSSYKELNNELYIDGLVGYLQVLEGDKALLDAQIAYISAIQKLLNGYVELFIALGGGVAEN